jgi:general stress protein YciG
VTATERTKHAEPFGQREEREAVRSPEEQGHVEGAGRQGGKASGSGGDASQGGTTAQKKKAGRKGGKATAAKKS